MCIIYIFLLSQSLNCYSVFVMNTSQFFLICDNLSHIGKQFLLHLFAQKMLAVVDSCSDDSSPIQFTDETLELDESKTKI